MSQVTRYLTFCFVYLRLQSNAIEEEHFKGILNERFRRKTKYRKQLDFKLEIMSIKCFSFARGYVYLPTWAKYLNVKMQFGVISIISRNAV